MIYVGDDHLHVLKSDEFDLATADILIRRPDFKKIFNRLSLCCYWMAARTLDSFESFEKLNICVLLPPSGPEIEDFKNTNSEELSKEVENFKKIFSPKAHLYFTNSLVASQIAIDFQIHGKIDTLNPVVNSLENLYSFLNLNLSIRSEEKYIVIGVFENGSRIFCFVASKARESNENGIQNANALRALLESCSDGLFS